MRRKFQQPAFPAPYFRDGVLNVPGYTFEKGYRWVDTGSMTILVEGSSLKDGSNVLAKIAPAQSNGSMCLEREAHILNRLAASSEAHRTTLRFIDIFNIPRSHGDCVVLLLLHPGLNLLGRYLPPSKVNSLLLADIPRGGPPSMHGEVYNDDEEMIDAMEAFDIMDLASFLEFAIQATQCLETVHSLGVIHREVRANAFHLNSHSGLVKLVHFGNRAVSLEEFGGPSSLVIRAFDDSEKLKVKEALCYLAPEQTGAVETMTQDHRTDLYSLGVMFWTLLVGRGQMPFEGGPLELLHAIVQKRPMPVHEVRRDVPQVLACIIDKLLAKSPDARYQSGYGLKTDLMECQRRLLATVTSASDHSLELIPFFDIATHDRFTEFTMPTTLFGREKELEIIRNVIRHTSSSFSRLSASNGILTATCGMNDDHTESSSSRSASSNIPMQASNTKHMRSPAARDSSIPPVHSPINSGESARRAPFPSARNSRARAVIVSGPPGVGKSSMILANQAKWRSHGLWGQAKFQSTDSAPFAALLSCMSSALRQLMVFHTDLHRFVNALKARLGPQLRNVPLLYQGTPELKDVLDLFDIDVNAQLEPLTTSELRARFQSLVENVFSVIAETRLFALFLDDLHEADVFTLDLVRTLVNSRSRMLIFATIRSDKPEILDTVRSMFTGRSRPTWISLEPLSYSAISSLVSKTLHRPKDDAAALSRFIYTASSGNPFAARNLLSTFQRQHHVTFNWEHNYWQYDMHGIETSLAVDKIASDPSDLTFLISHLRELPEEAFRYMTWAAFFGETFKMTEIASMMDSDNSHSGSSGSSGSEDDVDGSKRTWEHNPSTSNRSMRGLQIATAEGWLIQRARDMCNFSHDRYRQAVLAEAQMLPEETIAKMSLKIILMTLHETPPDVYRIAEHAKRCLPLLRGHPKRSGILEILMDAGESAFTKGAHELALQALTSARTLLCETPWNEHPDRTLSLFSRLAELSTWKGDYDVSDSIVADCYAREDRPEDKAKLLRLRSRNHWMRNNLSEALNDNLLALRVLGIEVNARPSQKEAESLFEQVKNEIMAVGFDEILAIPKATDPRTDLAVALLNDAGTTSYWSNSGFDNILGLTTMQLALRSGMSPGTAVGFFWAIGAAAEGRELYRFSADLAKLALLIAERHGTSSEKCRAQVLFCAMVSGFNNVHIRANIPRLEEAIMYGQSAGDKIYTAFASIHMVLTRLFICDHMSELVIAAEESLADIRLWSPQVEDSAHLAMALLNCIRALGGFTDPRSPSTVFDTDSFKESEYLSRISEMSGNTPIVMNWYNSFKLVGLFCVGFVEEAAFLGFSVYETRDKHPNHRHVRYALFFHSLAMIASIRKGSVSQDDQSRYLEQIDRNQAYIRKWLSPSPVNCSTWIALVDAELASLHHNPEAFKRYDIAVKLAVNNDWILEEGWALYLQGSHFVRSGVDGLGSELQRRGISRQSQWGAQGIANYLNSVVGARTRYPLKRNIFTSDVAVQTENFIGGFTSPSQPTYGRATMDLTEEQEIATLSAADLASILKWSKVVSSDINLSSALQRLTEIAVENSGSHNACVVIAREVGDYTVATSMVPPDPCQVHENPRSIRDINDPLQKAVIHHTLNAKERVCYDDAGLDSRFSTEAGQSPYRSVICLPIFSNRGQTFGAIYLAAKYPFSRNTLTILTLLCQQASTSIANALLFRSVQAGTRENLKMIAAQRDALEAARKSREDALKATKIKSNFLASMSHELRTPFSSFYGLLDLLGGTELTAGQSEIVQTAKQSCELLLKIIDSILDYSKLEASAVKLEFTGFPVENIIADCMELLLPMAAKKLDLSYHIEPNVPAWVTADYARIRQVLMNLIGNAVKFTASGSVTVTCSATEAGADASEVCLKFTIQDTGFGLASSDVDLLFVPFQQADNSSTRKFGGTGLGLSISRQLVKLMGGAIGVKSELKVGSTFWFTIPVKIYTSEETQQSHQDLEDLKTLLMKPHPLRILIYSQSPATLSLLSTMLDGFQVAVMSSLQDVQAHLEDTDWSPPLDFIILDDQSEVHIDDLARLTYSVASGALRDTKIIHLYTPTTNSLSGFAASKSNLYGVCKMTKPPRKARLLQTLADQKNLPNRIQFNHASDVTKAKEALAAAQRTLYGRVLVAEDNPIAQNLLIKQLEKYNLNVTAVENGIEAINEWETHEPGYFTVALFDHHMPICDGVEAAKRLRILEKRRKTNCFLPIVALSADAQESTKQLCLSAGMNAFFSKPLKKSDLLALMSMFAPPSGPSGS